MGTSDLRGTAAAFPPVRQRVRGGRMWAFNPAAFFPSTMWSGRMLAVGEASTEEGQG